jgi:hypothetical protein
MLGRSGGRIGSDLYPTEGKAAGVWRLSEIYNEKRFRLWPPELNGGQSTLNLLPIGTSVDFDKSSVLFGGYGLHKANHIRFSPAIAIPVIGTSLEFNGPNIKFDFYKLSGGSLS